ncbi:MAG: 50S ribosomal protein L29 [Gammaproteobacteria bacterium]|nr:50S ribosomal protein L29 [Gammaproteobacteria bacterium]
MKNEKLADTNVSSLKEELISLLHEQFNLRMQKGSGTAVKPHLFKRVRRQIARIKTRLHQGVTGN